MDTTNKAISITMLPGSEDLKPIISRTNPHEFIVYAAESVEIYEGARRLVRLGFKIAFPADCHIVFRPISKQMRAGVRIANANGPIATIEGEVALFLDNGMNPTRDSFWIDRGDIVATCIVIPIFTPVLQYDGENGPEQAGIIEEEPAGT